MRAVGWEDDNLTDDEEESDEETSNPIHDGLGDVEMATTVVSSAAEVGNGVMEEVDLNDAVISVELDSDLGLDDPVHRFQDRVVKRRSSVVIGGSGGRASLGIGSGDSGGEARVRSPAPGSSAKVFARHRSMFEMSL